MEWLPSEPIICTKDIPGSGGTIGPEFEHFIVEELPLYEASGAGEHWYVYVTKRGLTTPEMLAQLGRAAGVAQREIGYAGLKDKHGVTSQWLSFPGSSLAPEAWKLPASITVQRTSRHQNKLRTGHLRGNRFSITLVGTEKETQIAQDLVNALLTRGLPNYFGAQRFGRDGGNLSAAVAWFGGDARRPRKGKDARFRAKFYASVVQSEVFNRYLSARIELGLGRLLKGDVVRLAGTRSHFIVEDVERELPRFREGDLILTGPMFGPKMLRATADAQALEEEVFASLGLASSVTQAIAKDAPGTRRDLVVQAEGMTVTSVAEDTLVLEFSLPAGSFATQLVREFTRAPWLGTDELRV